MNINMFLRKVLPKRVYKEWRKLRFSLRDMMRRYWEFRREHPDEHEQFRTDRVGQWD